MYIICIEINKGVKMEITRKSVVKVKGLFNDNVNKKVILVIERTEHEHEKDGDVVKSVKWIDGKWEFPFVASLSGNSWAYSTQITPIK